MANQTEIVPVGAGKYAVRGELSFATVPRLRELGSQLLLKEANIEFDLQGITRSDSAALTLLTAWTRQARRHNKTIVFTHLPSQLLGIAKLSSLEHILPMQTN